LQRITGANFDDREGDRLRQEADIEGFFAELNGA